VTVALGCRRGSPAAVYTGTVRAFMVHGCSTRVVCSPVCTMSKASCEMAGCFWFVHIVNEVTLERAPVVNMLSGWSWMVVALRCAMLVSLSLAQQGAPVPAHCAGCCAGAAANSCCYGLSSACARLACAPPRLRRRAPQTRCWGRQNNLSPPAGELQHAQPLCGCSQQAQAQETHVTFRHTPAVWLAE
jgi:hypothetical protein